MRKSFQRIRDFLGPDSVLFLGDLFDGGREWSNDPGARKAIDKQELVSSEKQWREYGQRYWMKEYRRFGKVFFDTWAHNRQPLREGQRGRRFIAGLPGNHDLGLGGGIRLPARKRFTAFFGEMNRVDVIGNHSFVSLDTVSLSAKDQVDVDAGTQGVRDTDRLKSIWEPVGQFLHEVGARKARAIDQELRVLDGRPEYDAMDSIIYELGDARSHTIDQQPYADTDIPSIVLTHVPLYRSQGTPCGPLREKYPPAQKPTAEGEYVDKDDRNSIQVAAGKQYQNVLTPAISNEIIEQVQDVSHVFSGDDHDYCEIIHREYTSKGGGVREITVKSTSWAMGVRHPGFLLVSLWNPIDAKGKAISPDLARKGTIQTHLCLLPDQLTLFIRYGVLLVATLAALTVRAFRTTRRSKHYGRASRKLDTGFPPSSSSSYLPTTRTDSSSAVSAGISLKDLSRPRPRSNTATHSSSSNNSSSSAAEQALQQQNGSLNARSTAMRSISPGYNLPAEEGAAAATRGLMKDIGDDNDNEWNNDNNNRDFEGIGTAGNKRGKKGSGVLAVWNEFSTSIRQVAVVVLAWYAYLLWTS